MTIPIGASNQRAVIYCRQSRDAAGLGAAVERQENACRGLAAAREWTVVSVEVDNDISASNGKARPAWGRVLGMIERREVDVVIAWHLDRITRTMTDLESLIVLTQRTNVGIATATGDIDLTTDSGRMVARILAAVARGEVERKGQRQVLSNQQRVEQGRPRWSHRPFGYEKDGTLRESEADLLRDAYSRIIAGARLHTIRDEWRASGVTTTVGGQWSTQSLGKLIRDLRNCGTIVYQGTPAGRGQWEPIVSEEVHSAAVARLGTRKGGAVARSDADLVTVASCGTCGGRVWTTQHNGQERAYSCQAGHVHLPVEWVDGIVFLEVTRILGDDEQRARWESLAAEQGQRAAGLRSQHVLVSERLESLSADYADGLLSREQLLSGSARAREALADLEAELSTVTDADDRLVFDVEWFAQTFDGLGADERRALLRSVVDVKLHPRGKGNRALRRELVEVSPRMRRANT